jgi:hypothetical protein
LDSDAHSQFLLLASVLSPICFCVGSGLVCRGSCCPAGFFFAAVNPPVPRICFSFFLARAGRCPFQVWAVSCAGVSLPDSGRLPCFGLGIFVRGFELATPRFGIRPQLPVILSSWSVPAAWKGCSILCSAAGVQLGVVFLLSIWFCCRSIQSPSIPGLDQSIDFFWHLVTFLWWFLFNVHKVFSEICEIL